jgi:hypothetical protein
MEGFHNECNSKQQCVSVPGVGDNKCDQDSDCEVVQQIMEFTKVITEPIGQAAVETKKAINTPQGSAVTKTVSTAGLAVTTVATAAPLFSVSFLELFSIPIRLFSLVLTALGIRKRTVPWGVAYDSVTKRPLDPAYIVLKNLRGEDVSMATTDLDGRYGFLAPPGIYRIEAHKTNYTFPSKNLAGRNEDELHSNLYFGGNIEILAGGGAIIKNIPLDPIKFDWNEFAKKNKNLMKFYSKWDVILRKIYDFSFVIGFLVALVAFIFAPYPFNTIVAVLYLFLLLLRVLGLKPKTYGYVSEKTTGIPLSFAIIRVFLPAPDGGLGKEIASKPADQYGRYYCLVPPGKYYVKIEKKQEDGSYFPVYTSQIIDSTRRGIIREKFSI